MGDGTARGLLLRVQPVALEPAPESASPFELHVRSTLLESIKAYPDMSENAAHRSMNALRQTLHQMCNFVTKTMTVRALA